MASENIRWVPPLPQGWEAKYDPTQKRYFFIDHVTKATSWNDPRFTQAPVAPQPPAPLPAQHRAQSVRFPVAPSQPQSQRYGHGQGGFQQQQQPRFAHQQAEAIPMKSMVQDYVAARGSGGSAQASPQRLLLQQHTRHHYVDDESEEDESSFVDDLPGLEVDEVAMATLREQYPSCPAGKIRMLLERNFNSVGSTQIDIEGMGFEKTKPGDKLKDVKPTGPDAILLKLSKIFPGAQGTIIQDIFNECNHDEGKTAANLRLMGYHESSGQQRRSTPERQRDPAAEERERKRTISPKRPVSPAKANLSAAEKSRLVTKICSEFPNLDRTIVQLALETAEDKEEKARRMLSFMYGDQTKSPKKTSPAKQGPSASTSPARSTGSSNYTHLNKVTPSSNYTRPSTSTTVERPRVTSPPRQSIVDQRPKPSQAVPKTKHATKIFVGKKRVVTSQQQVFRTERELRAPQQAFTSTSRTPSRGPDPNLPRGADLSRVERYGAVSFGPNKELVHGPNKSGVLGSQGAVGADRSLRRGPQTDLRCGPQPDLCRGPAFLVSHNKVLVTSI